jgi:hypothetical protein
MSASVSVCTSDFFARRDDGNAVGFERVTTTLEEASNWLSAAEHMQVKKRQQSEVKNVETFTRGATDVTNQYGFPITGAAIEEIPTVSAEYQRANCGHGFWRFIE